MICWGAKFKRCWRPLIGIIVGYAIVARNLLIAVGGLTFPVVRRRPFA